MTLENNLKTDAVCVNNHNNHAAGKRVKMLVKAGAICPQHSEIQVRDSTQVKTRVKSGALPTVHSKRLSFFVATILFSFVTAGTQALAATYTVSNSPAITDHGDPNRPGSLQYVLNQVGSTLGTVVLPGDSNYNIGRNVVVGANVNLVFRDGAIITLGSSNSTLKIFGSVQAGLQQIFNASPGQVRFQGVDPSASRDQVQQYRRAPIKEVYPQWWGAINCSDCAPASSVNVLGLRNLQAFTAAFQAFPTRVYVPAGTYNLSDEWRLDINAIPEIPVDPKNNPLDTFLTFEVEGAGQESTFLIQDAGAEAAQFVGIYGDFQNQKTWASGKFHGLKILSRKGIGLKVQNPRIRVTDLQLIIAAVNGTGIELESNSIGCYFEHILMTGPAVYNGGSFGVPIFTSDFRPGDPTQVSPNFDPGDPRLSSGFKCAGGNVATITISRLVASYFDIGINLFGRDGGIVGLQVLFSDLTANLIGINIKNSRNAQNGLIINSFDIIGNYMEMFGAARTFGIRFDPVDPPYNVRVEGGHIDPKCGNEVMPDGKPGPLLCRPMEVHGSYNIIDVPYHGEVYGAIWLGTQIRSGTDLRCSLDPPMDKPNSCKVNTMVKTISRPQ